MEKNELVERLITTEDRAKLNTQRLDKHDEQIKELSNVYIALTKVDDKVTKVENDVSEIKSDLKDIKDKPAQNWNKVTTTIMGTIVGALTGGLIGLILK